MFSSTSVFALPGLVVALAMVFWAVAAPGPLAAAYQTFPLLVLAYAPLRRPDDEGFAGRYRRCSQALRRRGPCSRSGRPAPVPHHRSPAGDTRPGHRRRAGPTLTLKELPATLLLAPIGFETLATRIWNASEDGFFAEVGVTSLVLILLFGFLTWMFVLRREFTV